MDLRRLSVEELVRYASSKKLSKDKKAEIAAEFERRFPGALERIREARRESLEEQWRQNGCVKDSSGNWKIPYELIWRSLPSGEDR